MNLYKFRGPRTPADDVAMARVLEQATNPLGKLTAMNKAEDAMRRLALGETALSRLDEALRRSERASLGIAPALAAIAKREAFLDVMDRHALLTKQVLGLRPPEDAFRSASERAQRVEERLYAARPKWEMLQERLAEQERVTERALGGFSSVAKAVQSLGITAKLAAIADPLERSVFRDVLRDASAVSDALDLRSEFGEVVDRLWRSPSDDADTAGPVDEGAIRPNPVVSWETFDRWLQIIGFLISVFALVDARAQGKQFEELLNEVRSLRQEMAEGRIASATEQRNAIKRMDARLRALEVTSGLTNRKVKVRLGPSRSYGVTGSLASGTPVAILETRKRWVFVLMQTGDVHGMGWVPKKSITRPR